VEQPELYSDVNLTGTIRVLEAARRNRISRFVFASSSSVYGGSKAVPFREDDPVAQPESPYAATKRAGELICRAFHHLNAPEGVLVDVPCLRFFTVYGPRQRPEMAISKFTALLLADQPIPMFGDGSTLRDYTYVDDIVSGIIGALDHETGFDVFNIGGANPLRLDEMIAMVGEAVGRRPVIEAHPMQPGDVLVTSADCGRAQRAFGYRPKVSLAEGIARYVAWHRENRS
jgi:UDP-glucuronate 4-epimerase